MPMSPAEFAAHRARDRAQRGAGAEGGPEGRVTWRKRRPGSTAARLRAVHGPLEPRGRAGVPRLARRGTARELARCRLRHGHSRGDAGRALRSGKCPRRRPRGGASQRRRARAGAKPRAQFQVADARKLPFADASFDVVASALVINFIAERPRALAEMRRVARPASSPLTSGTSPRLSPSAPLRRAMRRLGADVPRIPGTEASRLEALRALFLEAGLEQIETRTVDVCLAYADFTDFWESQTPDYQPTTKIIAQMKPSERTRLMHAVKRPCLRAQTARSSTARAPMQ